MKKNILWGALIVAIIAMLLGGGYALGYKIGSDHPKVVTVQGIANANGKSEADFGTFWQAWQTIDDYYLKSTSIDSQARVYGSIKGLLGSLGDPYSEYFTPDETRKFQQDVQGNFGGIGAEIGMKKGLLIVVAPLKDSPSAKAGIKAGDMIVKINSSSTEGISVDAAVNRIRGQQGTNVVLNIFREGWDKPKDFTITRQNIEVPTLDYTMKDGGIAYIQLYQFNANASSLFAQAVQRAKNDKAKGIVLDVRNNPGGYLDVAVDIAGWFLPKGTPVVSEATKEGTKDKKVSDGTGELSNIPTVVLMNQGSASASEILAGTLRDNLKSKLIGEQSFGKGTVQQIIPMRDDSTIKITIAHWVLPSGKILENGGLKPDVEVQISDKDVENKKDPQLDKALEVVKSEVK